MGNNNIKKDFEKFYKSRVPASSCGLDMINKISNSYINPTIIEERQLNVAQMDVFSRLMMERIIFFGSEVNSDSANVVVSQLIYLDSLNDDPIRIYVNSPGGEIYSGNSILDTMGSIKAKVATHCTGLAASFGAMILSCGARGMRSALPHARIMIHQPSGGAQGMASDIEITFREIEKLKKELTEILAQRCKQDYDLVASKMDRDTWMTAQEALDFGLIDSITEIKWD